MWLTLVACAPEAIDGTQVQMRFTAADAGESPDLPDAADFWASPFPSDHRRDADGTVALAGFPNPDGNGFTATILGLLDGADGFSRSGAVRFSLSAPLPAWEGAGIADEASGSPVLADHGLDASSPVFLVDVDPASPAIGERIPVEVRFNADGGPYGAENELTVLPVQGVPLRPHTRYAAVVLRDLADLGAPLEMVQLTRGIAPDNLSPAAADAYLGAVDTLGDLPYAGIAVFTTGDPSAGLAAMLADARSRPAPTFDAPPAVSDTFDGYCVFHTTMPVPSYQAGEPPFTSDGGEIPFVDGVPHVQRDELANVWITVPRRPLPAGGWPTVVFVPTGGGGDRPLVDRGVRDGDGAVIEPGSGLARDFAAAGWAAVSIDTPHLGLRNVTGGDGQFLMFNLTNPPAMLDNFRQADFETARAADLVPAWAFSGDGCDGFEADDGQVRFDAGHLALFGHSMGGTIAPVAAAAQPAYRTLVWSGAGGSWIENVVFKQKPAVTRPLADALMGYGALGRTITVDDPVLSLVQWAGEATDPPLHAGALGDRDILMTQGIVDHYILPPIANALSMAAELDLAGGSFDAATPELDGYVTLAERLPWSGGREIALPASGNQGGGQHTRVVVQQAEDGVEDGHEVVFQIEASKARIREFLRTSLTGVPVVPAP
jgi:hypothetical protein